MALQHFQVPIPNLLENVKFRRQRRHSRPHEERGHAREKSRASAVGFHHLRRERSPTEGDGRL